LNSSASKTSDLARSSWRRAPLRVLIATPGRHLFEGIHDDRIEVLTPGRDRPDPDLVVISCGNDRHFTNVPKAEISERTRARIAAGAVGLVFDATTEGMKHKDHTTTELHDVLRYLNASSHQAVYVTQERQYEADYRRYCASVGFDPPVTVLTHDYWVWYAFAHYERDGEEVYQQRLEAFRSRPAQRQRRFVSLNRTARDSKILFLLSLLRDGIFDRGFVSFGGFKHPGERKGEQPMPTAGQLAASLPGFDDLIAELAPLLETLDSRGRILLGMQQHHWKRLELWNCGLAADLNEYNHSWFSVATETEMRPRPSRITEKSVKPLANFHPMLVLGNPGSLALIRSYGFATFEDVIDESYDEELDPRRRFDMVYKEVTRLCRLDEGALLALERRVSDKLMFNARWGLTKFPGDYRAQRDVALVNEILMSVGLRHD
jgi:hypothetical protein